MTTETRPGTRDWGTAALVKTTLATALLGLGVTVVGALVVGSAAAYGAAIGTALVVAVFGFGTFTVNAVAALMPTASLMFALLTYTLQLVAMALAFVVLSQSGLFDETVDATWLGCTVIAVHADVDDGPAGPVDEPADPDLRPPGPDAPSRLR